MSAAARQFNQAVASHRSGDLAAAEHAYRAVLADEPDHFNALFNLARLVSQAGKLDEAMALHHELLDRMPGDPGTLTSLGDLSQQAGRPDEAESDYRLALDIDPTFVAAANNLGALYLGQSRWAEAVATLANAASRDPSAERHAMLGHALTQGGRSEEAEAAFRQALALAPDHSDSLLGLGLLAGKRGDFAAAEAFYRAILAGRLGDCQAHRQLVASLLQRQADAEAEAALACAQAHLPHDPTLHFQRGLLLHRQGKPAEAARQFAVASEALSHLSETWNNYGMALTDAGRPEEALPKLRPALECNPRSAEAWCNLGNCLNALNRTDEAVSAFRHALDSDPRLAVAACNLGNTLRQQGELDEALDWFERALAIDPSLANAYNGRALIHQQHARHLQAIAEYRCALAHKPDYPEALNNLAISLSETGRYQEAVETYQKLLAIKPDIPEALFNLGTLLQRLGIYDQSIVMFNAALNGRPDYAIVYPYLAHSLMQQCNWDNLAAVVEQIRLNTERELAERRMVSVSAFALQSMPGEFSMAMRRRVAEQISGRYVSGVASLLRQVRFTFRPGPRNRLRIGYVSPDFRFHSVAVAFRGIADHHDHAGFEIFGYSIDPGPEDEWTRYFRGRLNGFRRLSEMPFRQAAETIHADQVDILVDLAGHTRGARLELFALRPAPIQVHYLGYSATTGAPFIDYLITDHQQVPPRNLPHFSEQLVYLPDTFMATQQAAVAKRRPSRGECGLPDDAIVFANFNAHYKFEPSIFGTWMRLLRKLPKAVLWLLEGTPQTVANLRREAERRGVRPDRLIFAGKLPHAAHLARLPLADLALDNLYHGGGVTTVDALWVGLPVLTVAGETPQSRNGANLLAAIDLPELCTASLSEYEQLALALAAEPARLATLRRRLLANRERSPLFDAGRLTRNLETVYRAMWRRYAAGLPPGLIEPARSPSPV
ncbi:MAG: tetratricopeptide repeat protein [Alphaproteobacteria bacterium]|nr:tetratricopeptide repeat protein [Alphaproteobacteria bacterium]